ncbi:MAG TPA: hypothetical protein ENJ86_00725 [Methylothermaceae bacterium]|nr:hypothetical protein [Methylothermaceae bacterium]
MEVTMKLSRIFLGLFFVSISSISCLALAEDEYEVTITNLTRGQTFSPILALTHKQGIHAFMAGEPAISQLVAIAEEGNTAPALSLISQFPNLIKDGKDSGGPLTPGKKTTLLLKGDDNATHLTVLSMLIFSNDAFLALNGQPLPTSDQSVTYFVNAFDAGSEANDESCSNIPGQLPGECANPAVKGEGEGFVHIHSGIHGIGDLTPAQYDWRNPVAKITIRKVAK